MDSPSIENSTTQQDTNPNLGDVNPSPSDEMGFISSKLFPACESLCVCCPALRSRSRQPVKRYNKLLAAFFTKSLVTPYVLKLHIFVFLAYLIMFCRNITQT